MECSFSVRGVVEETRYFGGGGGADNAAGSDGGDVSEVMRGGGDCGRVGREGEVKVFR